MGSAGVHDIMGNLVRTVLLGLPPTSVLGHATSDDPDFDGWPRWDSLTHQSVYEDWLCRAAQAVSG